jgi:ABC-2 type transport system ATP-binding protein
LEVAALSYAFGARRVLDEVSFEVRAGDFTVLLGLNGAGKSTLFALITRLYSAQTGRIAVFGRDVEREPLAALARMGVVFQQPTLDLDLTVAQNLTYHASLHGMGGRQAAPLVAAVLGQAGLAARAGDRVRALSGGLKRRVELARALLHGPRLLLLDEPTVGLDMESRAALLAQVRELCSAGGLAVLWATHLIDEAADDARVVVLHEGRVLENRLAREVRGDGSLGAAFERLTRRAA